jgi:hypothetical protein
MRPTTENIEQGSSNTHASRMRSTLCRVGLAGGAALVFVLAASLIDPDPSRASQGSLSVALPDGVSIEIPAELRRVDATTDVGRSLGELRGRTRRVEIIAGRAGAPPTYRVVDAHGNVLADNLHADEVYTVDPDLTIDRMGDYPDAGEGDAMPLGGSLMLLDGDRFDR